jgi:NifU-like protein involved in Fe-S cluster formation
MSRFPGNSGRDIAGALLHIEPAASGHMKDHMEEAVTKYYRQLLRTDFENSGSIESASISIETVGEQMIHCGNTGSYMRLYLMVHENRIRSIKYQCSCEPTANVAVEILCNLVKGKTLDEVAAVSEQAFYQFLGCRGEELQIKVRGLLALLNEGIDSYLKQYGPHQ